MSPRSLGGILMILLAGCVTPLGADDGRPQAENEAHLRRVTPCPEQRGVTELPSSATPAPYWPVGSWWNYTERDGNGTVTRLITQEVVRCEEVNGVTAYVLQERVLDVPVTGPEEWRSTERAFDTETLNHVWNRCDEPRGYGECKGRYRAWDFPLHDGKVWEDSCCPDFITKSQFRAEALNDTAWKITARPASSESDAYLNWTYSSELHLFTERVEIMLNGLRTWALTDYELAAPDR